MRIRAAGAESAKEVKTSHSNGRGRPLEKSEAFAKDAAAVMPGGLWSAFGTWYEPHPSPRRDFAAPSDEVRPASPPVFAKSKGAKLTDVDGNEYVDYVGAQGALILGHADERVVAAISKAASKGYAFGVPSDLEVRLAELITSRVPAVDMLRLVPTPIDALAGAVRVARRHTGRSEIVTFEQCWHGRVATESAFMCRTGAEQVPGAIPYNDIGAVGRCFAETRSREGGGIAAVIVEPVGVSLGLSPPARGFLELLRTACDECGALLIFDETFTAFRVARAGASDLYGIDPDLTLFGAVIGGGLPLAAFGGRKRVMELAGAEAGTLHDSPAGGNLLAAAAGLTTLQVTGETGFHDALEARSARLDEGLRAAAAAAQAPSVHTRVASMVGLRFSDDQQGHMSDAWLPDSARFSAFHTAMLDRGVLFPPSPSSCLFVSAAHTDEDIDRTIAAANEAFQLAVR